MRFLTVLTEAVCSPMYGYNDVPVSLLIIFIFANKSNVLGEETERSLRDI